jgi:rhodanese-related sulfurtransferase
MLSIKFLLVIPFIILSSCNQQAPLSWDQITAEIKHKFNTVNHITVEEFFNNPGNYEDSLVIDVRDQAEYEVSHIPGAIHMPHAENIAALAIEKDKNIIVYCSVGYRSAIVAQQLQKLGFNNVTNLEGSIFSWANQGLPMNNQIGITKEVHPYNQHWGQLLEPHVQKSYGK